VYSALLLLAERLFSGFELVTSGSQGGNVIIVPRIILSLIENKADKKVNKMEEASLTLSTEMELPGCEPFAI